MCGCLHKHSCDRRKPETRVHGSSVSRAISTKAYLTCNGFDVLRRGFVVQSLRVRSLPELEQFLRLRLAQPLPGADAQWKFAPSPARKGWRPDDTPATARRAAYRISEQLGLEAGAWSQLEEG